MTPDRSEGSITKGIWFVLEDETNTIKVWGSCFTGKEIVYLNDQVVSESRSVKLKNSHRFEDDNRNIYEVNFITTNLLKGELECYLTKNGIQLKKFSAKYNMGQLFNFKNLVIITIASVIFGGIMGLLNIPEEIFFVIFLLITIIFFLSRKQKVILIEESNN